MRLCQRGISGILVIALFLGLVAGIAAAGQTAAGAESEYFVDPLENLSKTFDASKGWSVKNDANTPEDPTRIYRQADVPEYITYRTDKAITGYMVKVYSMQLGQNLKMEISTDGTKWEPAYFVADNVEGGVSDGWSWTYLVQEDALPDNIHYFKVTAQNDSKIWQPQISEVELYFDGATMRPASFEEEAETVDLVVRSAYHEELELLYSLGIYVGRFAEEPGLEQPVTRAELAKILVRMSRLEQVAQKQSETTFQDVQGREDAGYIQLAVDCGYLKGYADQTFEPDGTVSVSAALESMVRLLAYDRIWPEIPAAQIAGKLGLTGVLSGSGDRAVTKEQMAGLIWKVLNTNPVMRQAGNDVCYIAERTLLEENYELEKHRGVITATAAGAVYGETDLSTGEVGIDGLIYQAGDSRIQEYLGYGIVYYTRESSAAREVVVHFSVDLAKNKPITVSARDICFEDPRFTIDNFVYASESGRVLEKKLDLQYCVRNGERKLFETAEDLKISDGHVTILDSDGNGNYDTMLAEDYIYIVPWSVDKDKFVLMETFGTAKYDFSEQQHNGKLHIFSKNRETAFSDLKPGMVLAVALSENGERVRIYASETKTVASASVLREETVTIQDHTYHMTQWYQERCGTEAAAGGVEKVEPGRQQKFYLDHEMNIVAVENIAAKKEYAYLTGAVELPMNGGLRVRLFTARGEWLELTSAGGKLLVDDGTESQRCEAKTVIEMLANRRAAMGRTDKKLGQVVKYTVNGNGELTELAISKNGKDPGAFSLDADDPKAGTNGSNIIVTAMKKGADTINSAFSFSTKTAVFAIPEDEAREEDFSISYMLAEGNVRNTTNQYHLQVYDSNEMNEAGALVIFKDNTASVTAETSTNLGMIKELNRVLDPETGAIVNQLVYVSKKAEQTGIIAEQASITKTSSPLTLEELKPGDVVMVRQNGDGKINNIRYVYRLDTNELTVASEYKKGYADDNTLTSDYLVLHGVVQNIKTPFLLMQGINRTFIGSASSPAVAVYDGAAKEKVQIGTLEDIRKGDEIVFRSYRFQMSDIMIFRSVPEKDENGYVISN